MVKYELGYNGKPFKGTINQPIAVDTETDILDDPKLINNLAIVSISDGERTILIRPQQLPIFIRDHPSEHFVFHNFSYDYWVIRNELEKISESFLIRLWDQRVNEGLNHDTMLLDGLLRLSQGKGETYEDGDSGFYLRGLGDISKDYAGIVLDKSDPFRKRYHEIIGKKFSEVKEDGFWSYAAKDSYATAKAWPKLYSLVSKQVERYSKAFGNSEDNLKRWKEYGLLTEQIQIKGHLALTAIERNGMPFSPVVAAEDERKWREKAKESIVKLNEMRPSFFKKKNGRFEYSKKSLTPSINQAELVLALSDAGLKIKEKVPGFMPPQSSGKLEGISKASDDWIPFQEYDPFLKEWIILGEAVKRLSFYDIFREKPKTLFSELEPDPEYRINSRINPLMKTGRTSYKSPNLQQMPRDPEFRSIFRTPKGKKFITVDYAFIELRTLAATCLHQVGFSTMAEVIKKGIDPHAYTASMIKGVPLEEFLSWKKNPLKADEFKKGRQAAKALNFGIPGGLGASKLVDYAAMTYGVFFTLKEAEEFKNKIIREVYPELNDKNGYLSDDTIRSIAINTGLSKGEVEITFPGDGEMRKWIGRVISKIAWGSTVKKNGDSYDPDFYDKCWDALQNIGVKAPLDGPLSDKSRKKLKLRTGDWELGKELTLGFALTLTGRVRSKIVYTESRNTPFQGLAADGAKLSLWELTQKGYKVCAFIHDEIVVEVDEADAERALKDIEETMNRNMEKVLGPDVPCGVEGIISDSWNK